jgi:hypothetical protein
MPFHLSLGELRQSGNILVLRERRHLVEIDRPLRDGHRQFADPLGCDGPEIARRWLRHREDLALRQPFCFTDSSLVTPVANRSC